MNSKEYFAELSEAYFGRNDFYPFVRSDLQKHDPQGFQLMEQIWGKPRNSKQRQFLAVVCLEKQGSRKFWAMFENQKLPTPFATLQMTSGGRSDIIAGELHCEVAAMRWLRVAASCRLCSFGILLFAALSVLQCSSAYADGMMLRKRTITAVGRAEQMVASPRQEALLICIDGAIQITLRTSFRAGPTDVAWIIPVPHPPDRVEEADDAVFAKLEDLTAPRFYAATPGISIGCRRNRGSSHEIGRIVVAETGKAGIYDYTVLTATGTQVLLKWLNERSYHIPDGSERIFSEYVDRGWCWLAIRLNSQRCDKGTIAPRPVRYTYHDKRCVYPLIISQLSADDDNEIVLYVLSRRPYGCENWANSTIPREQVKPDRRSASGTNYEELFRSLTGQADGHLFVPEFVWGLNHIRSIDRDYIVKLVEQRIDQTPDAPNELHLTRLRAVVRRESMDRDVILTPTEYRNEMRLGYTAIDNVFRFVDEQNDVMVVTIVLFGVLLLSTGYLVHRRMKHKRLGSVREA